MVMQKNFKQNIEKLNVFMFKLFVYNKIVC